MDYAVEKLIALVEKGKLLKKSCGGHFSGCSGVYMGEWKIWN